MIKMSKNEVNEKFGRNMSEDISGNKKLIWKEAYKGNGEIVGICNII